MEQREIMSRITELEQQIATLPVESISTKRIDGREYYYRRCTEGKKRRKKFLPAHEVASLREQIKRRKTLEAEEAELKKMRGLIPAVKPAAVPKHDFITHVRTGGSLRSFAASGLKFKKRECF